VAWFPHGSSGRGAERSDPLRIPGERYQRLGAAIRAGVKIGVGTDFVGFPVEHGTREFALLVEAGLTPMQAIQAGTRINAELLG
jgi:imidazolonepropionase-like amidohydrolase